MRLEEMNEAQLRAKRAQYCLHGHRDKSNCPIEAKTCTFIVDTIDAELARREGGEKNA